MKNLFTNLDFWGSSTSLLCAIHCALLPILLSVGMINGRHWIYNDLIEVVVLGLTFIFVYLSIIKPFMQSRKNAPSFYLACFGILLLSVHHMFESFSVPVVVTGGIFVAFAHIYKLMTVEQQSQKSRI